MIVRQDDPGDTFFVVALGEVVVEVDGLRLDKRFTIGDYFGEISIFTGEARTASIVAATDATIYEFQGEELMTILAVGPWWKPVCLYD